MNNNWQAATLKNIELQLKNDPGVLTLYVFGSFAEENKSLDIWSDLDLLIVVRDEFVSKFYPSLKWVSQFGKLFAYEQSSDNSCYMSKVIFENNKKIDFVFVTESKLNTMVAKNKKLKLIFSNTINPKVLPISNASSENISKQNNVDKLLNSFWFIAHTAVTKISRNDLLIGFHLTLDLYRKYLELLMWLRDKELKTTIHRYGGMFNEKIQNLQFPTQVKNKQEIINIIESVCVEFDDLASQSDSSYASKINTINSLLSNAKQSI